MTVVLAHVTTTTSIGPLPPTMTCTSLIQSSAIQGTRTLMVGVCLPVGGVGWGKSTVCVFEGAQERINMELCSLKCVLTHKHTCSRTNNAL